MIILVNINSNALNYISDKMRRSSFVIPALGLRICFAFSRNIKWVTSKGFFEYPISTSWRRRAEIRARRGREWSGHGRRVFGRKRWR